jgi:hypothetical protein
MENTFDLKKFLVENKLTNNSRLLKEEEEVTPELKAQLLAKAEKLANSPAIRKQIEDQVKTLTPEEQQAILDFAKQVNENLTESKLVGIVDKLEDTGIDFSRLEENDMPATAFMGAVSSLAVSWMFIKGMLLDGGPEALAVVGPPVAAVLAVGAVVMVAEAIINYRNSKKKPEPYKNNTGITRVIQ